VTTLDVEPFKGLFASLAALGRINVEVWNAAQPVFSTVSKPSEISVSTEARDFSERVRRRATFQQAEFGGRQHVFGMPLSNGGEPIGALLAYTGSAEAAPHGTIAGKRQAAGDQEMERFLGHLAGLIEQHCGSQKEIESLAAELAKALEDIYVYSTVAGQIKSLKFPGHRQTDLAEDIMEAMRMDLAFIGMPEREENNVTVCRKELAANKRELELFVKNLMAALRRKDVPETEDYFMINASRQNPAFSGLHPLAYRFLAVKIRHKDTLYGWLGLVSFKCDEIFKRSELRLLISMAEQLALVIFGSDLYYDLERLLIHVVKSLVNAIEAKDVYTRGHSERVSR